jgi:hypothetical protein
MKKPKEKTMTLRLNAKDAAQIEMLAAATNWTDAATIRTTMRIGFACLAREPEYTDKLISDYEYATAIARIEKETASRIAALKNRKEAKS